MSLLASMQYYLSIISLAAGLNCKRHDTIFYQYHFFFFFLVFSVSLFLCALFCSKYILLIQQKRKPETHAYLNHRQWQQQYQQSYFRPAQRSTPPSLSPKGCPIWKEFRIYLTGRGGLLKGYKRGFRSKGGQDYGGVRSVRYREFTFRGAFLLTFFLLNLTLN